MFNREIKERLKSIVYTLVFLVGMTWFWYGPRQELTLVTADMNRAFIHSDAQVISNGDIQLDQSDYSFQIKNEKNYEIHYEIIIDNDTRKQRKNSCQLVSNNYLTYQLKLDDQYDVERNLPVNGVIYSGVLKPNEIKPYSLKMHIDKDESFGNECYYPMIRVSTYDPV